MLVSAVVIEAVAAADIDAEDADCVVELEESLVLGPGIDHMGQCLAALVQSV